MLRHAIKRAKSRRTNWRHNRLDQLAQESFAKKKENTVKNDDNLDWYKVAKVSDATVKLEALESETMSEREKMNMLKSILLGEERLHPEFDTWR